MKRFFFNVFEKYSTYSGYDMSDNLYMHHAIKPKNRIKK